MKKLIFHYGCQSSTETRSQFNLMIILCTELSNVNTLRELSDRDSLIEQLNPDTLFQ